MKDTQIKEDISISYISALCAYAGVAYEINRHDEDSTDGILKKRILLDENRKFDAELRVQLKCTSSPSQYTDNGDSITYKLKVKNYNDLCMSSTTPIILGLLVLPEDEKEWIKWSSEELLIKGCMGQIFQQNQNLGILERLALRSIKTMLSIQKLFMIY
jgi:hypothetical protein